MEKYRRFAQGLPTAACLLALLLTAAACLDIYFAGVGFSRESIALRASVLVPVWIGCVLVGLAALPAAGRRYGSACVDSGSRAMYRRDRKEKPSAAAPVLLLLTAAVFIVLGVINGGARDVLIKAINICTECIGLG